MNWKKAYLETRILSASGVELVNILYEHAILNVEDARDALVRRDIACRAKAISRTIAILGELESSLDHERGGEIAKNLSRLYRYMRERLTLANLNQVDEPLAEVARLLTTMADAWQQIGTEKITAGDTAPESARPSAWGAIPLMEPAMGYSSHGWSA